MKKVALPMIAAAVVALGLYIQLAPDTGNVRVSREASSPPAASPRTLPSDAVLSIAPGAPRAPVRAIEPRPMSPLMTEYAKSRDHRALYDRLRSVEARTAEENYVLAKLLEQCARIAENKDPVPAARSKADVVESRDRFMATVAEGDPQRDKRIAAYDEAAIDPCGRLRETEVSFRDVRELFGKAAAGGDPKAIARVVDQAVRDGMTGPDGSLHIPARPPAFTDAQVEMLRRSMQSGDPYAVIETVRAMNASPGMVTVRRESGESSINMGAIFIASTLAACELGLDCGPSSREMLSGCAFQGHCGARDYRDYMFFYGMSPATAQLAGEYQAGLLRAVQGDWSYFTLHRGSPPTSARR